MTITIRKLHPKFAAEVRGVDLRAPLDDESFGAVRGAFHEFSVLVFPDQAITDEQQVAFSRRFGALETTDFKGAGSEADRHVYQFSNLAGDGSILPRTSRAMTFLAINERWHTDSSFKPVPAMASLLSAKRVPARGGGTEFASMRVAWEELPPERREAIEGLRCVHSYAYSRSLFEDRGAPQDEVDALPPAEHPLVRTHAPTGERSLYVSGHIRAVAGMPENEGRALVDTLMAFATRPENVYTHRWRANDLVMWDNRCALHRAEGFPEDEARIVHRTTVAGEGRVV